MSRRHHTLAVIALSGLYLLQAASPIRLDNDSVVYLQMGAAIADGRPVESTGLPAGYPAMIAILDSVGLGWSFVFVLVNCAFIALGVLAANSIFRDGRSGAPGYLVPLTLLSLPIIRFIAVHQPESMFLGVSLAAVALMNKATRQEGMRRGQLLIAALALTMVAITVRLVGFALVPALVWACFHREGVGASHARWTARAKAMVGLSLAGVAVVAALVLGDSFRKYAAEAGIKYFDDDVAGEMIAHVHATLETFGAVVVNVPWTQFRPYSIWWTVAGAAGLILILTAVRVTRPRTPAGVYLASFFVILLLWPYTTLRLWLPIIPLIIGYLESAELRFTPGPKWRRFMIVYVAWYAITGLAALAYTTRISLAGRDFPRVYGQAGGMSAPDPQTGWIDTLHNRRALELMNRYGNPFQELPVTR